MPLRPSQVETLRAVARVTERTASGVTRAFSVSQILGTSEAAAYARLYRLEARRYLASKFGNRRIAFYLTQLGREALEGKQ